MKYIFSPASSQPGAVISGDPRQEGRENLAETSGPHVPPRKLLHRYFGGKCRELMRLQLRGCVRGATEGRGATNNSIRMEEEIQKREESSGVYEERVELFAVDKHPE
ncbi:hypothetical protein E2C01_093146 [Portunus trituberculatus]|uniref:Uncharacterized protein n=1 Tax=Portunus trituberculatus TaxID=210409 RepID=A0A5B7JI97_PORTR|nr:hypothetical protein [Portunus trituberculatus]